MATRHIMGSARFDYTPAGGSATTHLLGAPLRELEPADVGSRYEWWSEDRTTREIVTVGSGVRDLLATIRFDDAPDALKAMLREAVRNDVTLTYRLTAGGTAYPVKVVAVLGSPADGVAIQRDRDRGHLREYEARVHLRRVDGGALDGLL